MGEHIGARIAGIDIETTGLDFEKDHVTEIAWIIKEVGDPKAFVQKSFFVRPAEDLFLTAEIEQLTKIKMKHLLYGEALHFVLAEVALDLENYGVDYIVAHNGEGFDKPFLSTKGTGAKGIARLFETPWIDTSMDCVYPPDCRYTNLMYVAAYFGFLNPFSHSALFDIATTLKVLDQFPFDQVVARAKSPWCVVEAGVSYETKELAKARRYSWENLGNIKYSKKWVKKIKECDLEKEMNDAPFPVHLLK